MATPVTTFQAAAAMLVSLGEEGIAGKRISHRERSGALGVVNDTGIASWIERRSETINCDSFVPFHNSS